MTNFFMVSLLLANAANFDYNYYSERLAFKFTSLTGICQFNYTLFPLNYIHILFVSRTLVLKIFYTGKLF